MASVLCTVQVKNQVCSKEVTQGTKSLQPQGVYGIYCTGGSFEGYNNNGCTILIFSLCIFPASVYCVANGGQFYLKAQCCGQVQFSGQWPGQYAEQKPLNMPEFEGGWVGGSLNLLPDSAADVVGNTCCNFWPVQYQTSFLSRPSCVFQCLTCITLKNTGRTGNEASTRHSVSVLL